jgi:hypothetical protein
LIDHHLEKFESIEISVVIDTSWFRVSSWRHMVHYRRCHGPYVALLFASLFQRLFEHLFFTIGSDQRPLGKDITIAPNRQPVFKFGKNYVFLHFGEVIS